MNVTYEIIEMVNHAGVSVEGGHYTALVKNFRDRELDGFDAMNAFVSESNLLERSSEAYLLLLKRQ